jgi:signal transduction histidine kinase
MAENLQTSTRALESEKEKVSGLLQAQQELTAGVSHELRTPAAVISGYLESLRSHWKNSPPEVIDRDLETASNEAGRLKKILNDLLDLSQANANRLSVSIQPVSLEEILQHTLHVFQPLAWESKRVEVTAEIPADLPAVMADPTRLEQALLNLVQNGLRHTSPGGLVAISAEISNDWAQVNVEDTGEGITPQDLPHIWERFYRGNGQTEFRGEGGAGLGLAIVKEFIEAMDGQVSVQSCPGQGSIFSVRLRIAKE